MQREIAYQAQNQTKCSGTITLLHVTWWQNGVKNRFPFLASLGGKHQNYISTQSKHNYTSITLPECLGVTCTNHKEHKHTTL